MTNKIIFLDVDGVLNSDATWKGPHADGLTTLCPDMCDRLARIVRETQATVVLSSTWRLHPNEPMEKLRAWLLKREVVIHSMTPDLTVQCGWGESTRFRRGDEIDQWLLDHPEFEDPNILILDDYPEFNAWQMPFFVNTDEEVGLTDELADKAIEILNGPQ
jgi:hypothetical protein